MALLLEGPGSGEILFEHPDDGYGAPLVGPTGEMFNYRILRPLGIPRSALLIGNTIRCRPPMNEYPTGPMRTKAETACRHWDDAILDYNPNWFIPTYHPSAIFQKPQFEEFVKESMKRAWEESHVKGQRPMVLMGLKAMNLVAPYLKGGMKKWQRGYWSGLFAPGSFSE